MKIIAYTPELQEITGLITKSEPWLHFGATEHNGRVIAAIWVWDTREIIEIAEIDNTVALIDQIAAQSVADDNWTTPFMNAPIELTDAEQDDLNSKIEVIMNEFELQKSQKKQEICNEFDNIENLGKKFGKRQAIRYINDMVRKLVKEIGGQATATCFGSIFDNKPVDMTVTANVNALYDFITN